MTLGRRRTIDGIRRELRDEHAATPQAQRKFLPEVQGLRALAVLMVSSYHIWFGRISGGVDVFLLISAFLLTGQFVRTLEAGKPLALGKYWTKLLKRLLPMVAVTLLATLGATYLFLPRSRWVEVFSETWASMFYYQNWNLAFKSVDYYVQNHSASSPLQHFWSLSIQGQIFIIWPIIFLAAAFLSQRFDLRIRALLTWIFSGVFIASLTFSIFATNQNQAFAYFDTRARLWEFALGSLLALVLPYIHLIRPLRLILGWVGLLAMLSCGFILQVGQQFPGYIALWPTLAAGGVIAAGYTGNKYGADKFLSWRPLVRLGGSSYALYLFHWPILVIFLVVSGKDQAGLGAGLLILLFSVVAAWSITRFVDAPLRQSKWLERSAPRSLAVILICIISVAVPVTGWQTHVEKSDQLLLASSSKNNPGAVALLPGYVDEVDPSSPLLPTFTSVEGDWPAFPNPCDADVDEFVNRCENGMADGSKKIVVLGSSHAHVWNTPLLEMAADNNWSLVSITKGFCPLGIDQIAGLSESCVSFNQQTMAEVLEMKPDVVVTTSTRTDAAPAISESLDASWVD